MMRTIDELKIARDEAIAQNTRWALSASECFALYANSSSLSNADLSNADLSNANLSNADLSNANLYYANLSNADLSGANLSGATLYYANLSNTNLSGANLRGADLYYANLTGANLYYADLTGANLTGADLRGANLSGANLSGATLYYANGIVRFGPLGSRSNDLYIVKHDASLMVKAGCFWGMETDFLAAVAKTHGDNRHAKAYRAALVLAHMVLDAAETAEGGRMMSVDEKAREMARQYIPHEGGFSMGGLLQNIIEYFEADVAQLRADRNAAQQRAEQAERERHEARAVIDRAIEILVTPFGLGEEDDTAQLLSEHKRVSDLLTAFQKRYTATSSPHWTPQTGAEIAAAMGDTPILPPDFQLEPAQPAPTVKADDGGELTKLLDQARDEWDMAGDVEMRFYQRTNYLHAAVGHILDIVERLVKGGAS